jgi:integrase/recombinase XerD
VRRRQCDAAANPHGFRHHFSSTWPGREATKGDLTEPSGWSTPQTLTRHATRARSYGKIMDDP